MQLPPIPELINSRGFALPRADVKPIFSGKFVDRFNLSRIRNGLSEPFRFQSPREGKFARFAKREDRREGKDHPFLSYRILFRVVA